MSDWKKILINNHKKRGKGSKTLKSSMGTLQGEYQKLKKNDGYGEYTCPPFRIRRKFSVLIREGHFHFRYKVKVLLHGCCGALY